MYNAYIVELKNLRKHNNADRLQCAEIFGNNVIVDLSYYEGQKVVFFPTDGKLNKDYAEASNLLIKKDENGNNIGGYMDADKCNIKAIRLRGEKSEGLVLPIETPSPYTDVEKLKVGEKINTLNGVVICEKYIPVKSNLSRQSSNDSKKSKHKQKESNVKYPLFREHVDTDQLAYNLGRFKEGDRCVITLKCHGTSARTQCSIEKHTKNKKWYHKLLHKTPPITKQWKPVSGSRRVVLKDFEGGYHGSNEFRKQYHDFFSERLEKGETVYYEFVGWMSPDKTIMGIGKVKDKELKKQYGDKMIFSYGCDEGQSKIFVYRMTLTNEDGFTIEYPDWLMRARCKQMFVECVPKFEEFTFTTQEDLMERVEKYYDGADPIGMTHIREGVVVRIENRLSFKAYKHKNFTFKIVEGIIKDTADAPDIEEAEKLIQTGGDTDEQT